MSVGLVECARCGHYFFIEEGVTHDGVCAYCKEEDAEEGEA